MMSRAAKVAKIDCVVFRPDSRNGSKDYAVPFEVAQRLWRAGTIHGDATNGGYMPNGAVRYDMLQHRVPPRLACVRPAR